MSYQDILDSMPYGLEKHILQALSKRVGKENAIKRYDLLNVIHGIPGFEKTQDRQLRHVINDLRKAGNLIASLASEEGGYYACANLEEYYEFANRELGAKIRDMSETLRSMESAARVQFGDSFQPSLI
jgi:hypothetical protein